MSVSLGDAIVYLQGDKKPLENTLNQAEARTRSWASGISNFFQQAFSVALGNQLQQGFAKVDQAIRQGIATGFDAVASNERLRLSYESLVASQFKSADSTMSMTDAMAGAVPIAKQLYDWNLKLSIKSPFGDEDISKVVQMAMGYKFTTSMSKDLTQAIVDQTAATGRSGANMENVIRALGQMNVKNKVQQQELNQLSEAGVDYVKVLDAMGKTLDDVEKGNVAATDFVKTFLQISQSDFGGAAERQATSWAGLAETFNSIVRLGLREFFGGVLDAVKPLAVALTDAFGNPAVTDGLRLLGQSIGQLITPAIQTLTGWVEKLPERIKAAAQFIQQLRDELSGLSAADILAELGPGLAKMQQDLDKSLAAVDRAHTGALKKLEGDITQAGAKLGDEMGKIAKKYAPDIAKLQQRIGDATQDFNQRAADQAEQFAKRRADLEKRLTKEISDQEERLTELKKEHARRRQELVTGLMFAETEEQYLQIKEQLRQEDEKYNEQKAKTQQAGQEQTAEIRAQLAEQEAEQKKAEARLKQDRDRAFRDLNQQMAEIQAKRGEEEAKVQEAYNTEVQGLRGRIEAENEAYAQQRADLQAAFTQQMSDFEAQTQARAAAIGQGMAHTIAQAIKDFQAAFNADGFSGVLDLLIAKVEAWANDPANQGKMQSFGEMLGQAIANGLLKADLIAGLSGKLSTDLEAGIQAYLDIGGRIAGGVMTGIIEGLTGAEVSQPVTDALANVWRAVVQSIITTLFPVLGVLFANEQFKTIKEAFAGQSWAEIGENIMKGIGAGISKAVEAVKKNAGEAGGDLLSGIKDFFGIHSESKVMADEVGVNLAGGIGKGFKAGMARVQKLAGEAMQGLGQNALQPALATLKPVTLQQTNYLPAAPAGFDREGLLDEIEGRTLSLMKRVYEA